MTQKRVKVKAKEAKKRAKEREKEMARELEEEKKVADNLAALKVPKSKGVRWDKGRSRWQVQLSAHRRQWQLGWFSFDDHKKAVAMYGSHKSKTEAELEALRNSRNIQ
jgi:hypothetical protein